MIVESENLHTFKWLSEQTNIPIRTLYHHAKNGLIPFIKIDNILLINILNLPSYILVKIKSNHGTQ